MTGLRSRSLAALVLVLVATVVGCQKEARRGDATLPDPAQGEPAKLVVARLLASIPADTPYLFAALDPPPPEYYDRIERQLGPLIELALRKLKAARGGNKVLDAIWSELEGKWNRAGIESLGFSGQPRFAIYGLGLELAVARFAVKDDKVVEATIRRIAAKAGAPLPATADKAGRKYWQIANPGGPTLVVALADNQLIAAIGAPAEVSAKLGLVLGTERPGQAMTDGRLVAELMAKHGFGGQLIGFASTRRIASKLLELAGAKPRPACTGELDRLSAKLPRLVFGYRELSVSRISGGMVVELSPDVVADLKALTTEVPGLAAALSGQPMMALGGGLDVARGQKLGLAVAASLKQLGAACELRALVDGAGEMAGKLSAPLPDLAGRIAGGVVSVDEFAFSDGPDPEPKLDSLKGVAVVASPDARALFRKLLDMVPQLRLLGLAADGKLHGVGGGLLPVAVSAGIGDRVIVVATGDKQRALGDKLIGEHGGGKAPLFAVSYDLGRLLDLKLQADPGWREGLDPELRAALTSLRALFGHASMTIDVTDAGLALQGTVEMK